MSSMCCSWRSRGPSREGWPRAAPRALTPKGLGKLQAKPEPKFPQRSFKHKSSRKDSTQRGFEQNTFESRVTISRIFFLTNICFVSMFLAYSFSRVASAFRCPLIACCPMCHHLPPSRTHTALAHKSMSSLRACRCFVLVVVEGMGSEKGQQVLNQQNSFNSPRRSI